MNRKNILKGDNLFQKFILAIMVLAFCFAALPVLAVNDKPKQTAKKTTKTSDKCWKRVVWVDWTTSVGDGRRKSVYGRSDLPVCMAFEKVLNTNCAPPEMIGCNWTLPEREEKFRKLTWTEINPKEHWDLVRDIYLSGMLEKYRAGQWELHEPEYKKVLAEGRLKLFISTADVDHNGKVENIVKLNRTPDCPNRATYAVITRQTRQMDWKYRQLLLHIFSYSGSEIMIYDGSAYMFRWDEVPGRIMIYEGYILPEMGTTGAINICQYQYLKGGKKK